MIHFIKVMGVKQVYRHCWYICLRKMLVQREPPVRDKEDLCSGTTSHSSTKLYTLYTRNTVTNIDNFWLQKQPTCVYFTMITNISQDGINFLDTAPTIYAYVPEANCNILFCQNKYTAPVLWGLQTGSGKYVIIKKIQKL